MKKPFLTKLMNLLEKEICHEDLPKDSNPLHVFKPFKSDKMPPFFHDKPSNIASKCLKPQETVLSEGVTVKGELHFDKQLRINGSFEGSLYAQGKVIIGEKGSIKGDIHLDTAEIHGKVLGNITVKTLILGSTAQVTGNIKASLVNIQKGAKLLGQIEVDADTLSEETALEEASILKCSG